MQEKMSVNDLVNEINYQCNGAEPQTPEVITFIYKMYVEMFENQCGVVPNFSVELTGHITLLPPEF